MNYFNVLILMLWITSVQVCAMNVAIKKSEEKKIQETCLLVGEKQCFDTFYKSELLQDKYLAVLLFVKNPSFYKVKTPQFLSTLQFLVEAEHRESNVLYAQLLGEGYIFDKNLDASISFMKQSVFFKNTPEELYLLAEISFEKYLEAESAPLLNEQLLNEIMMYLNKAYSAGDPNSGKLLAFIYFHFFPKTKTSEATDILLKLISEKDEGAKEMYKALYEDNNKSGNP